MSHAFTYGRVISLDEIPLDKKDTGEYEDIYDDESKDTLDTISFEDRYSEHMPRSVDSVEDSSSENKPKTKIILIQEDLDDAFHLFDVDKKGYITENEFLEVMQRLEPDVTLEIHKKMFRIADADRDGVIGIEEYYNRMSNVIGNISDDTILKSFNLIDIDKDEKITYDDMTKYFDRLGIKYRSIDIIRMLMHSIYGAGGFVLDEEMLRWCKKVGVSFRQYRHAVLHNMWITIDIKK
jgi:Ca2+-binding EF-hand superfamily protein